MLFLGSFEWTVGLVAASVDLKDRGRKEVSARCERRLERGERKGVAAWGGEWSNDLEKAGGGGREGRWTKGERGRQRVGLPGAGTD